MISGQQLAIEHVVCKVFAKYSITSEINDQIRSLFKDKVMEKKLAGLGGTKRFMKDSNWTFANEMIRCLMSRKRRLEQDLKNEVSKWQKIETENKELCKKKQRTKKVFF